MREGASPTASGSSPSPNSRAAAEPRTWEALGVAQDGDGDEQGGSSSPQEADPPRPHPQRVLGGDVDPARSEGRGTRGREAVVGDGAGQLRVPLAEAGTGQGTHGGVTAKEIE